MQYPTSTISSSNAVSGSKSRSGTKCSWCDRKRARNDLCNVCRQKVESRARRLMEQKLEGDKSVIEKVMKYLTDNLPMNSLSNQQTLALFTQCFPFLMLKFQSENTYRGKKGNRCWCLPESVLKKLIAQFYEDDSASMAVVQKGGRNELCDLLMSSVKRTFREYGIQHLKPIENEPETAKSNTVKKEHTTEMDRRKKRTSMDEDDQIDPTFASVPPPRKRTKRENDSHSTHNNNSTTTINHNRQQNVQPDHQIWGRSDTELLSFDIHKLDSFLRKFEREVLDGHEIEKIEPSQRINFLKGRCKEFTKILTELRDYVIQLRTEVENHGGNAQINRTLDVKDREIAQLKQRLQQLSHLHPSQATEILYRCVVNLLTKLSPNPVDTALLRSNMDKLQQYHDLACTELSDAVRSLESVGSKLGCQRSSDQTLKEYAACIDINVVNNNNSNKQTPSNTNTLYVQQANPQSNCNTPSITSSYSNSSVASSTPNMSSYASTSSQLSPSMMTSLQNATFSLSQPTANNNNMNNTMNMNQNNVNNNQRFQQQSFNVNPMANMNNLSRNPNMSNLQSSMSAMNSNNNNNIQSNMQTAANTMNNNANLNQNQNRNVNRVNPQHNNSSTAVPQAQTNPNALNNVGQASTIMIAPIGNPFLNGSIVPSSNFITLSQQPTSIPFNAATALNSIECPLEDNDFGFEFPCESESDTTEYHVI